MHDLSKMAYFVPNLPRFEVDREKFFAWWDAANVPIKQLVADSRGNAAGYEGQLWDGVTIYQKDQTQQSTVWSANYHPNDELFGQFINEVLAALPWFDVQEFTLWSNKKVVAPHQDGFPRDPLPAAPRISLFDDCEKRTFYVLNKRSFKAARPDLTNPEGTNLFFFNNENFLHGASEPKGGRKILMRIDGPLIDVEGFKRYINTEIENGARYEII
jgi:hypothetical protein